MVKVNIYQFLASLGGTEKILVSSSVIYTRATLKVLPPVLLRWPVTSEADAGDLAVEVDPSRQYPVKSYCCVRDSSGGAVCQRGR